MNPTIQSPARRSWIKILLALVAALLAVPAGVDDAADAEPAPAQAPAGAIRSSVYYPPDVVGQFNALSERADALGFGIGDAPDPITCRHYQGIARSQGPGVPYLFVTHNGNHNGLSCPIRDDFPGALLVVKMASRGTDGERLRSNRIQRGLITVDTPPPAEDEAVTVIRFNGRDGWPAYHHPGGVQLVGDVLAVPVEAPCLPTSGCAAPPEGGWPESQVLFLDVSNPTSPKLLSSFDPGPFPDFSSGLVGLTPTPDGRFLLMVTGQGNDVVRFYRSKPTQPDGTTNLASPALQWDHVYDYLEAQIESDIGQDWPGDGAVPAAYQMMNFVREGGPDGPLYVVAARNTSGVAAGDDVLDLFRVIEAPDHFTFQFAGHRHLLAAPTSAATSLGEGDIANFAAASGVYVSPSGNLLFYATEHDNDGPPVNGKGTVKAGEWRNHDMVRPGSPTLSPTVDAGGPYSVTEGGTTTLTGVIRPPITHPWVELYAGEGFTNRSLVIDYDDRALDDFDDFGNIEANEGDLDGFSDDAQSARWYAPPGCTFRLNDDDYGDHNFPGDHTATIHGDGQVHAVNLKNLKNDKGNGDLAGELTSITWFDDCQSVYNSNPTFAWDLDGDDIVGETGAAAARGDEKGPTPTLSAAGLDGPGSYPVDLFGCMIGQCFDAVATVNVTNAAPTIATVTNDGPKPEGSTFTVAVSASDPGGAGDPLAYAFDCDGDGTYEVGPQAGASAACQFADDGSYPVGVKVADDDGGVATGTTTVVVTNVAPTISGVTGPGDPLRVGTAATVGVAFTDPGTQDSHTCTFTWDDGQPATVVTPAGTGSGSCASTHTYAAPGVYRVTATVDDGDGGVSPPAAYEYVVVYDPAAGFVTGAGAITTPAGRGQFTVNSQYGRTGSTPSGQVQFRVQASGLGIEATTQDWLVVSGPNAQVKGAATVNGKAGYTYVLTVTDGDQSGRGGSDRFRLRVWDTASGATVFDNVPNRPDDIDEASPAPIENGNVVIHRS